MTQRGRAAAKSAAGRGDRGRPRVDLAARRARLRSVIEPVLTGSGYDLEDLTISRAGRRHVVRVIVDSDAGVTLDDVADVSRAVSAALDRAEETGPELIAGEYQLEVSSPGVDRPLTQPRHWRRNRGRLVRVTVTGAGEAVPATAGAQGRQATPNGRQTMPDGRRAQVEGGRQAQAGSETAAPVSRQITARVVSADTERVVFDLGGEVRSWAYHELGPGRVQVEFNRLDPADDEPLGDDDEPFTDDDGQLGDGDPVCGEDPYEIDDDEDVEGEER